MNAEDIQFYTCRRCSTTLFTVDKVLHSQATLTTSDAQGVSTVKTKWHDTRRDDQAPPGGSCTSVFLEEAPTWATDIAGNSGRFLCPKCRARVGSFVWSGETCSCGRWITPAFQFQLARVDAKRLMPSTVTHGVGVNVQKNEVENEKGACVVDGVAVAIPDGGTSAG